jgi:hypothetical protein
MLAEAVARRRAEAVAHRLAGEPIHRRAAEGAVVAYRLGVMVVRKIVAAVAHRLGAAVAYMLAGAVAYILAGAVAHMLVEAVAHRFAEAVAHMLAGAVAQMLGAAVAHRLAGAVAHRLCVAEEHRLAGEVAQDNLAVAVAHKRLLPELEASEPRKELELEPEPWMELLWTSAYYAAARSILHMRQPGVLLSTSIGHQVLTHWPMPESECPLWERTEEEQQQQLGAPLARLEVDPLAARSQRKKKEHVTMHQSAATASVLEED